MPARSTNKYFYQMPVVSKEAYFISDVPILLSKNVSVRDRNWSTRLEVHDRLFTHHTLSSIHRDRGFFIGNMASNDSLDMALSSIYVHSEDYNVPKSYVPMQPQTLNIPLWKVHRTEYRNISSGLLRESKSKTKIGKSFGPSKMKVAGPKISIAATSSSSRKKQTTNYDRTFAMTKKYKKVSGKMTPRQRNAKLSPRHIKKYAKSPSTKTMPLSSGTKYLEKYQKTAAVLTQGQRETSSVKKYAITRRDVKSAGMMTRKAYDARDKELADNVLDKIQRRESYAAQMRAIERIHPSSLKLAIDGPHSDQTNPGYSRKIDGTFYGI